MKGVYARYLRDVASNCFKDKHMAVSFTNMEQINLCKDLEYEKYFGKFDDALHKHRDST